MSDIIYEHIQTLLKYGLEQKLLKKEDMIYSRNRILSVLGLSDWQDNTVVGDSQQLSEILDGILDWAYGNGVITTNTITERDILDTEIMDCLMPRPGEVIRDFQELYEQDPEAATDFFYHLSNASNYIRTDRIAKNKEWKSATPYGEIDITINLSRPEKDPKEIALLQQTPVSSYPTCLLCVENEGYKGNLRHPARATHRIVPIQLGKEEWCFQYSPYVYYNEHCIIFSKRHVPMKISDKTFDRLLDFIEKFPGYFLGSNADLPIVGGSILSHDHFQGGRYEFALERAEMEKTLSLDSFPSVMIGIVKWPMSVLRVRGEKEEVNAATKLIWRKWLDYSDQAVDIVGYSGDTPHNTVTPIARRRGGLYEMDIVLRNNRTTDEFPDGIFHPHKELHHVKKENIGLIEVMGLAVLPGRLAAELEVLAHYLIDSPEKEKWDESVLKHWGWYQAIRKAHPSIHAENVMDILQKEVGGIFLKVLEHAGVFKRDKEGKQAFLRFLGTVKES
ncbi:UDP-glucose--hexose-1-phosphate uridylyltransferase [Bacillus sp. V59.32b]|uniref:UDP-glucose--hexose-1-phosphate uridylyltransferase n=1 Tax=Bacillus sp. V59.32b TaxID=1758642 RepID=UPI000E3D4BC0|nr:UDP-glucose--hexose-1-phosphate uridylyltransferase [Bacillus sp. V59.32b]RFU63566.1 UDP-glucose--hexose-1-phosphate uridylyltransferase [Bacillus sp. V59.32b]